MKIIEHFDKNNLHHAYLIEGMRDTLIPDLVSFVESLGVSTLNNPDFCQISIDAFKMDEARSLREMGSQKSFADNKKFFVVSANSFTLDAQQALLKMFEEPIENTHFFVIVPDVDALLATLLSRFYIIRHQSEDLNFSEAEKFIKMPLQKRIDFIKEFLADDNSEDVSADSPRARALKFLNLLEVVLHDRIDFKNVKNTEFFGQIFTVREFLRQPGSAPKTLLESLALSIPTF